MKKRLRLFMHFLSGFDSAGRKTRGFTTRDAVATWDETQWEFDPACGVNTAKQYADGSRIVYVYTDNGRKTRTTRARGAWKENAYNERNLVSGTTYSATITPSVAYTYADSVSLVREWLYNRRSELVGATLGTSRYGYDYDSIENLLCSAGHSATNTYILNNRNQYTSILRASVSSCETSYFQKRR